jgi:hypothetical protein
MTKNTSQPDRPTVVVLLQVKASRLCQLSADGTLSVPSGRRWHSPRYLAQTAARVRVSWHNVSVVATVPSGTAHGWTCPVGMVVSVALAAGGVVLGWLAWRHPTTCRVSPLPLPTRFLRSKSIPTMPLARHTSA